MVKVITYGTFDMLHYGHISLLKRAKALGDYLIVGITSDDYDRTRGKINNQQSLIERIKAIKDTGIADEIIVEEYEGQKIDDICRMKIDIFTVGSDWIGYFDYLNEYCKVIYLPRTEGVSSSIIRAEKRKIQIGIVGDIGARSKFINESRYVNGVDIVGICSLYQYKIENVFYTQDLDKLLNKVDAVYIISDPTEHYRHCKAALLSGKHVLCESPLAFSKEECNELFRIAKERRLILMEAIKTAYSTAYERLVLLAKAGKIGEVVSVNAVCTSQRLSDDDPFKKWNSICSWGPTALLPIMQILGIEYNEKTIYTKFADENNNIDAFTKINFTYHMSVASIEVAKGVKGEGELVVSGTKGYIYVPAPWWKTDYFEVRYENQEKNQRFFYQLDGEGIRYEIVAFIKAIESGKGIRYISKEISCEIAQIIGDYYQHKNMVKI